MPKSKTSQQGRIEKFRGNFAVTLTSSANTVSISLIPVISGSTRLTAMSDAFMFYRFTRVHWIPVSWGTEAPTSATVNPFVLGYSVGLPTASPTSVGDISELTPSVHWSPHSTANRAACLRLQRADLRSNVNWWKTRSAVPDQEFEIQGILYQSTPGATDPVIYRVEYEIEFKDFVPTAITYSVPPTLSHPRVTEPPETGLPDDGGFVTLRVPRNSLERKV